jgi:hypothetical protein
VTLVIFLEDLLQVVPAQLDYHDLRPQRACPRDDLRS